MKRLVASPAPLALGLCIVMLAAVFMALPSKAAGSNHIDQLVLDEIAANSRTNFFIKLASDADLSAAEGMTDRVERLNYVHDRLVAHAKESQANVIRFLNGRGVRFQSFWINNSIYVYGGNQALLDALAKHPDVAYIEGDHQVPIPQPIIVDTNAEASVQAIEWGVDMVNAPDVWAQGFLGEGIVVANVDTGVRWTHNALENQYRGGAGNHDYNWWDPDGNFAQPNDNNGHGTHTMGTMVGDDGGSNQIGVAPGATWIAAQGCDTFFCSNFDLTSSAQWIACPTRVDGSDPNCAMAPHVVNNSWGGGGGDSWYQSYVNSWIAAGIIPVFSAGNSGSSCSTMGSPGDYNNVIGVGSVNINRTLSSFSSRGPGVFRAQKPDVSAPGENVRSSWNSGDNAYSTISGTSMAAPHVAGGLALLLDAAPAGTNLIAFYKALINTASQNVGDPSGSDSCGGKMWNDFPNYHYGYGIIDLCAALDLAPGISCP